MDKDIKTRVSELLCKRDYDSLLELCERDRHYWQEIRFRLYDLNERIRWPAIETVARVMRNWWNSGKEEKVRQYIRTLFWSMNEESGGIGWSSPQAVAEIIVNLPTLVEPYGRMMIAHCIDEPSLVKGCLWGIGRMGLLIADSLYLFRKKILDVFQSNEGEVLALASWAIGEAGFEPALPFLQKLGHRTEEIRIYVNGNFSEKTIGLWAEEAIVKIEKQGHTV